MSSKDKSLLDKSDSAQSAFFDHVVPSTIFDVRNFDYLHLKHNRSIAALTNPVTLSYTDKLNQVLNVLQEPEIAAYQSCLLRKAVKGISAKGVDIDHIQIGLKLTEKDIAVLLDPSSGLTNVKTKARMERLQVKPKALGAVNKGFKKGDRKPFFSRKFRIFMDSDDYRYMDVLIAEPTHPRNGRKLEYNCLLECIPTRLTPQHISLMLCHIDSTLNSGRYKQLIKHALLLRLDTGYVMHGVSQLFAFVWRANAKVKVGSCIPSDDQKRAVETTYIGDRDAKHVIAYDKVLKENKQFVEKVFDRQRIDFERVANKIDGIKDWFPSQATSLRIESRDLKIKESFPLRNMDKRRSLLEDISFIDPLALRGLKPKRLKKLIKDKTLKKVRWLDLHLECQSELEQYEIRFDVEQMQSAFSEVITNLKGAIYNPSKDLTMPLLTNYSTQVVEAREIVKPLIDNLKRTHDSPEKIVRCAKPAVYVEGCPGSGKTKLIIKRVKHLLDSGVDAANICVLAFTNEASQVFKKRLRKELLLRPEMFVGTFSSWCKQELLNRRDSKVIDQATCVDNIKTLLPKNGRLAKKFEPEDLARTIYSVISYAANFDEPMYESCIDKMAPQLGDVIDDVIDVIDDFNEWKKKGDRVDFNDLLVQTRKRLANKKEVAQSANRFGHILLDEVQDTNAVQWAILKSLNNSGSNLFCVGDPAQSMYGFRGANDKMLSKFTKLFKNAKVFQLINNHRSTSEITALANHLRRKINRNYSQSNSLGSVGSLPRYRSEPSLESAIKWIVEDIKTTPATEPKSSCLILCRYNVHTKSVEKALAAEQKAGSSPLQHVTVKAMTYHGSKGLEAGSCYVIDPLFSNFRLGSKKEELCNAYVAFTRAISRLTVIASERGSALYGTFDSKKSGTSIFAELAEDYEDVTGVIDFDL